MLSMYRRIAGAGPSNGEKKEDEQVIVPPIPAPEETMFKLSDGREIIGTEGLREIIEKEGQEKILGMIIEMTLGKDTIDVPQLTIDSVFLNLKRVIIPDGYSKTPRIDFLQSLEEVIISNTVTDIHNPIMRCPKLKTITIGSSFSNLADTASITIGSPNVKIKISKDNATFETQNGFVMPKDGTYVVQYFGKDKNVTIPDGVTYIYRCAFSGCSSLTSVTMPDSLMRIGRLAFSECSGLTSITIPDSVTNIGDSAFSDCTSLTNVTIGNGVKDIDYSAFINCSKLTLVNMGNRTCSNVKSMSYYPWDIGVAFDEHGKSYKFEAIIRCSDGDIKTEIQPEQINR